MRDELVRYIRENRLIAPGDCVTCAVSGGADSMALLWALHGLRESLGFTMRCAHYNHGLRPEADGDEAFVRDFCARHDIEFVNERGDVGSAALPGESTELAARRLRYDFLFRAAQGGLLATAHTADDNLETFLLRLARGTSLRGLGGIPMQNGSLVRPLLFATRVQILEFLREEGIEYREDATNAADFCPRNRIRHHVVPRLREENPKIAESTLRLTRTLREEDAFLSGLAREALDGCRVQDGYSCGALRALPPVLRRRALFAILQDSGVEVPTEQHLRLLSAVLDSEKPSASACFPGGITVARRYDCLCVAAASAEPIPPTPLKIPGVTHIPPAGIKIICENAKNFEKNENTPIQFLLLCDMIGDAVVRSRQVSDTIQLPGGTRSLKRLMIDRRIPAARRNLVPVLADERGVIAVGGIGADVRRLAEPGENALRIQIQKEDKEYEW